ncbi:unnamed protein product [Linum trigynum]|uniref:Uncharacterized protein n=1 Tax=Linum trigynum TaxID=586398 RepID=A0AAV2FG25_9ROSI
MEEKCTSSNQNDSFRFAVPIGDTWLANRVPYFADLSSSSHEPTVTGTENERKMVWALPKTGSHGLLSSGPSNTGSFRPNSMDEVETKKQKSERNAFYSSDFQ